MIELFTVIRYIIEASISQCLEFILQEHGLHCKNFIFLIECMLEFRPYKFNIVISYIVIIKKSLHYYLSRKKST